MARFLALCLALNHSVCENLPIYPLEGYLNPARAGERCSAELRAMVELDGANGGAQHGAIVAVDKAKASLPNVGKLNLSVVGSQTKGVGIIAPPPDIR